MNDIKIHQIKQGNKKLIKSILLNRRIKTINRQKNSLIVQG